MERLKRLAEVVNGYAVSYLDDDLREVSALLRAAASETVGTEWLPQEDGSVFVFDCENGNAQCVRLRSNTEAAIIKHRHERDLEAARLAIANAKDERDDALARVAELEKAIDEAAFQWTARVVDAGAVASAIYDILRPHATRREEKNAERQWSSEPPTDRSGKWWHAFGGKGCSGVFVVPEELTWDASAVRSKDYNLWLPYLDGDTRDTLPPLPNSSATVTGSPAPADDTRELAARLAECMTGLLEESAKDGRPVNDWTLPLREIIRDARRGGGA